MYSSVFLFYLSNIVFLLFFLFLRSFASLPLWRRGQCLRDGAEMRRTQTDSHCFRFRTQTWPLAHWKPQLQRSSSNRVWSNWLHSWDHNWTNWVWSNWTNLDQVSCIAWNFEQQLALWDVWRKGNWNIQKQDNAGLVLSYPWTFPSLWTFLSHFGPLGVPALDNTFSRPCALAACTDCDCFCCEAKFLMKFLTLP